MSKSEVLSLKGNLSNLKKSINDIEAEKEKLLAEINKKYDLKISRASSQLDDTREEIYSYVTERFNSLYKGKSIYFSGHYIGNKTFRLTEATKVSFCDRYTILWHLHTGGGQERKCEIKDCSGSYIVECGRTDKKTIHFLVSLEGKIQSVVFPSVVANDLFKDITVTTDYYVHPEFYSGISGPAYIGVDYRLGGNNIKASIHARKLIEEFLKG